MHKDHDGFVRDTLACSDRAIEHLVACLSPASPSSFLEHCLQMLLSRILEMQRAIQCIVENDTAAPAAVIVLQRAQYESFLNLSYVCLSDDIDKREELAKKYIAFAEYETIEMIGADFDQYRVSLPPIEQQNLDRRRAIWGDVRNNLIPQQFEQKKRKQKITWNGLGPRQMADEINFGNEHKSWYGMMSLVAHSNPGMAHKSITITQDALIWCQPDRGRKDSAEWLNRATTILFLSTARYLDRFGKYERDEFFGHYKSVFGRDAPNSHVS